MNTHKAVVLKLEDALESLRRLVKVLGTPSVDLLIQFV